MSHVDEGRIHAYLDRQLEFAGLDARQELEAHIAQCTACAALVERARENHATAAALLQQSEPIDVAVPPFDVVTARARRGVVAETRKIVRLRGLAWAASIVVAVGVGWYAQLSLGSGGAGEQTLSDSAATLRMIASTREADSNSPTQAPEVRSEVSSNAGPPAVASLEETDVDAPAAATTAVTRQPEPADRVVVALEERARADQPVAEREQAGAMAGQERQRSEVASRRDRVERERRRVVDEMAPAQARLAVREADSAGVGRPALVLDNRAAAVTEWLEVDRSTAERTLGATVLAVDGLPLVGFSVPASGLAIVRVRQILPSGDSLEILQQSANTAGDSPTLLIEGVSGFAARGATSGETTVTTSVGELVVTGRAAIGPDSLRTLLDRLREASRLN